MLLVLVLAGGLLFAFWSILSLVTHGSFEEEYVSREEENTHGIGGLLADTDSEEDILDYLEQEATDSDEDLREGREST